MIRANEITGNAYDLLSASGAQVDIFDDENIVLVELPEGSSEGPTDLYTLPGGARIGLHQDGDYMEGTSTICVK